ncbi:MAG TPA: hypothetical protein VEA59_03100 [Patescibacteria group bacterium]|nr:hypothetical protein [Patescibacteria group bacterium]
MEIKLENDKASLGLITDVSGSTWMLIKKEYFTLFTVLVAVSAVWELGMLFIFFNYPPLEETGGQALVAGFLLPFLILGFLYKLAKVKVQGYFFEQFAKSNGFTYSQDCNLTGRPGSLFQMGHSSKASYEISGLWKGKQMHIFIFCTTIGYGKYQQTLFYTVAEVDAGTTCPHVLLAPDTSSTKSKILSVAKLKQVPLESAFEEGLNLYAEKELEQESLQAFPVEILEQIHERWPNFEIEIVGNKLYIYEDRPITKLDELQNFFTLSTYMTEKVLPKLSRMSTTVTELRTYVNKN